MKRNFACTLALITVAFSELCNACDVPQEISLPDGADATEEEMVDAGKKYHQFMIDNQLYQVCLEDEISIERANSTNLSKDEIRFREDRFTGRHNAASAAMNAATREFEKAVTDYEAQ